VSCVYCCVCRFSLIFILSSSCVLCLLLCVSVLSDIYFVFFMSCVYCCVCWFSLIFILSSSCLVSIAINIHYHFIMHMCSKWCQLLTSLVICAMCAVLCAICVSQNTFPILIYEKIRIFYSDFYWLILYRFCSS
jgi:hypothetical protein